MLAWLSYEWCVECSCCNSLTAAARRVSLQSTLALSSYAPTTLLATLRPAKHLIFAQSYALHLAFASAQQLLHKFLKLFWIIFFFFCLFFLHFNCTLHISPYCSFVYIAYVHKICLFWCKYISPIYTVNIYYINILLLLLLFKNWNEFCSNKALCPRFDEKYVFTKN